MKTEMFEELYNKMETEGLIPESGDSEYYWGAIALRIMRLLYERENNGNMNYFMEEDREDQFYHEMERDLNRFGRKFGFGNLGTLIVHGNEKEVEEALEKVTKFIGEKKDEWKLYRWIPAY